MSMDSIMSMDDRIDSLDDFGVKDTYVRFAVMRTLMDGPGMPAAHEAEQALKDFTPEGFRAWAADNVYLSQDVRRFALQHGDADDFGRDSAQQCSAQGRANSGKRFVRDVYGMVTKTTDTVATSRRQLKRKVSGSLGMPDDGVIRERVAHHEERIEGAD